MAGIDLSVGTNFPWAADTLGLTDTRDAILAASMVLTLVAGGELVGLISGEADA